MATSGASIEIQVDTSQVEEALDRLEDSLDRIIDKLAAIKSVGTQPKPKAKT